MNGLAEGIWQLVQRYNRCTEGKGKNDLFVSFYDSLRRGVDIDCGLADKAKSFALPALFGLLIGLLHEWDRQIDKEGRDIREARWAVYNPAVMDEVRRLKIACGIPDWSILGGLDRVERYFQMEEHAKACCRVPRLDRALWHGNCDFWMYNDLFVAYIRQFGNHAANVLVGMIMRWMRGYLPLDLALDNISDFAEDVADKDYNVLRWWVWNDDYVSVVRCGGMEQLYLEAMRYVPAARGILRCLQIGGFPATHKLLRSYLDAEVQALAFLRWHNYLVRVPEDGRPVLLRFTTKVFPWERDTREEVWRWLAENLPNGREHHGF